MLLLQFGKPISKDNHILYILAGLGSEYEFMISIISTQTDSSSVQDITSPLLTQENRMKIKSVLKGYYRMLILLLSFQRMGDTSSKQNYPQNSNHNNH